MWSVWVIGFPNGKRCRVFLKWSTKAKGPTVSLTWRNPSCKSCFPPAWKGAEAPLSASSVLYKRCWEESPKRKKQECGQIRLKTKWKKNHWSILHIPWSLSVQLMMQQKELLPWQRERRLQRDHRSLVLWRMNQNLKKTFLVRKGIIDKFEGFFFFHLL